tara:strand:- start:130 stop:444 length:315 start_codon:yes stop_codon:yes gene_type:complete
LKQRLKTELADISVELAAIKLTTKTFNEKAMKQTGELAIERKAKATLQAELSKKASELANEKLITRSLRSQLRDLGMGLVPFKGKKVAVNAVINETANTIEKRA